jgi:D-alanyl-D-alanine endopeptidase (penicillin-binding protein 7)
MIRTRRPSVSRLLLACSLMAGLLATSHVAVASSPSKKPVAQASGVKATSSSRAAYPVKAAAPHRTGSSANPSKRPVAAAKPPRKQVQVAQRQVRAVSTAAAATTAASAAAAAATLSYGERMGLRRVQDPLNLNSSVALVMDAETNEILLGKNDTAVLPIASLTKLMTGVLIADAQLPMDEMITITSADVDRLKNSGSRLAVGSRLTRGEALHLAMMSSENRAAHALARTFPGGVDHFVGLMNQKAASLGMSDTRFVDPTGLSSDNQSSARDLAILTAASHERSVLRELSTSPGYELDMGRHVLAYRNSNRLVKSDAWDIGLQKTGFIREAGRCVVMQVNVAGRQLIMVLLDATNNKARLGDAERLRRWVETSLSDAQQLAGSAV